MSSGGKFFFVKLLVLPEVGFEDLVQDLIEWLVVVFKLAERGGVLNSDVEVCGQSFDDGFIAEGVGLGDVYR